jgi:hypothetical protein
MELPVQVAGLTLADQRRYGETGFWFYRQSKLLQKSI